MLNSLELFSGAGGLAKGIEIAGANHTAFVEWNANACKTLRYNYNADIVHETDVRHFDFKKFNSAGIHIRNSTSCSNRSVNKKFDVRGIIT